MRILKKIFFYLFILLLFLAILPYFFPLSDYNPDTNFKPFAESAYFNIDNTKIHYRLFPAKDSLRGNVLLIHGFSGSTFSWRKNIDTLTRKGYRVLAIDLPAFGYSDRRTDFNHANSNRAKLLWTVIDKLHLNTQKWHISGHSMGAGVALAMAYLQPEKTGKIILVDGVGFNRPRNSLTMNLLALAPVRRWVSVIAEYRYYNLPYFQELLGTAYSQPVDTESANGYLTPFKIQGSSEAILGMFRNNQEPVKMDYSNLQTKTFVIWGGQDRWVNIRAAHSFISQYPRAKLQIIPTAGHCPMETHPQEFNSLFMEALEM
jgi:pimeloyl-ACP methyl ester carboxylesterase